MKTTSLVIGFLMLSCILWSQDHEYHWDNVKIGGGGYVTGVVVHPKNEKLWYIRTDVGGAYRYDQEKGRLIQIIDFPGPRDWNLYGCWGLDVDPSEEKNVYVALGKYPDESPHEVYKSTNKGRNWEPLGAPEELVFGGNNHPHRKGKPLTVNPHNPGEVWVGGYNGGLWIYDNISSEWLQIPDIPRTKGDNSIRRICFDKTDKDYIYVATYSSGVYRSKDQGNTFTKIEGSPGKIRDMELNADGGALFVASTNGIYRLRNAKKATSWEKLKDGEYRTVTTDIKKAGRVYAPKSGWNGIHDIYVSNDMGDTWSKMEIDVHQSIPWHRDGYPGAAISQLIQAPGNPQEAFFTDWYAVWKTDNIYASTVEWSNDVDDGHEEVVNLVMESPSSGDCFLFSGHADVSGFRHTALREYPSSNTYKSGVGGVGKEGCGFAVAPSDPDRVYYNGAADWEGDSAVFAISEDNGKNFKKREGYNPSWGWARIAVAQGNKDNIVVATKNGGMRYSTDGGKSWTSCEGASSSVGGNIFHYMQPLTGDAVSKSTFYVYNGNTVFRSTNGGKKWQPVASDLQEKENDQRHRLANVPGKKGHLWLNLGKNGLVRSVDGGKTWKHLKNVEIASLMDVGIKEKGAEYPTVFLLGRTTNEKKKGIWIYKSKDCGKNWIRINNEHSRIGCRPEVMTADRQHPGRVYIGTNGTGVWYGQPRKE